MTTTGRLHVGTSGWSYGHWRARFYPDGLPQSRWLQHYASRFDTVEVNASFYRLPQERTLRTWRETVGPAFRFAVKGSRYVTHVQRLRNSGEAVERLVTRIAPLAETVGPILWQLPPDLERDIALLRDFLEVLPASHRHVIEFRHPGWLDDEVSELLAGHDVGLVSVSSLRMPPRRFAVSGVVYLRLHGLAGGFRHRYTDRELAPWAEWVADAVAHGANAWVYFNNDGEGAAPVDAAAFRSMALGRAAA